MKTINSFLVLLFASTLLAAQQPTATPTKQVTPPSHTRRVPRPATLATPNSPPQTSSDFYVGEAKVDVTKDETVVRLAMAQHGSILIELPANDGPRYIIPGDPEMATVDQKALERNKRAIVVRPGSQFVPPRHNVKARSPAATVTAQMRSGLVVTFLFYPVEDLAQNVHRCVLNYNRDEVVARRRAAGLPVNLDDKEQGGEKTIAQSTAAPTSTDVEKPKGDKPEERTPPQRAESSPPAETKAKEVEESRLNSSALGNSVVSTSPNSENNSEVVASLHNALDQATKRPKQFKNWTHSMHGLKLSLLQDHDSGKPFNVVTVAVKNTTGDSLRLVADSPDLFIETVDEKGATLNVKSISNTRTETSNTSGAIAPGTTVYFVIAYSSPVLDAHQRLKIVVAQTNAADEPASIKLAIGGR
ncbi:MAG TPA: hypothetical protein DCK93_09265 [Blastocatellia bacterium]|nr:hypothetical protein [Blastocatellia bacterium]